MPKLLNPFLTFVFLVHCVLFLKIFQGSDSTLYSPAKMDLTYSTPTNVLQTTPRPRTSVKRNLIQDFENELPAPIDSIHATELQVFKSRLSVQNAKRESLAPYLIVV